jgi:hypothetical protein
VAARMAAMICTRRFCMRITEDRYRRDHARHHLALRLIRHEARSCTIRACTGLSDDRIRKLYRFYADSLRTCDAPRIRRRRGKSPRQLSIFTRTALLQIESSLLAGMFRSFGLLQQETSSAGSLPLEVGELLCDAYEIYRGVQTSQDRLSFEHGWFLWHSLQQAGELSIEECSRCRSPFVRASRESATRTITSVSCPICHLKRARHRRLGKTARVRANLTPFAPLQVHAHNHDNRIDPRREPLHAQRIEEAPC